VIADDEHASAYEHSRKHSWNARLTTAQKAEARHRRAKGAILVELARSYDVSRSTISRLMA
jgi:hypothetical protein